MKKAKLVTLTMTTALSLSLFGIYSGPGATAAAQSTNYLLAFKGNLPANYQADIQNAGGKVLKAIPELGGVEVQSTDPAFLDNLKENTNIQAANKEFLYKLTDEQPATADGQPVSLTPDADGTYWSYQWDIQRLTHDGDSYKVETGGVENTNGTVTHKAVVGIVDTGIDENHPDLKANFIGGKNFVPGGAFGDPDETGALNNYWDREGHGTHVAGSIAANGKVKGVGPDLGIRAYRALGSGGGYTSWIANAIVAAANDKVDVINMSIGGFDNYKYYYEGTRYNDIADVLLWKRAIQYAVNHNVTVVAAGGNDSLNMDDKKAVTQYMNDAYGYLGLNFTGVSVETPGQLPGVITVSSSNAWSNTSLAFYSNYGNSFITVAAPGGDNGPAYAKTADLAQRDFYYRALATWPTYLDRYFTTAEDGYAFLHGTSMASPKVTGVAAVIKARHPEYSPTQVAAQIQQTTFDFGKSGQDALYGNGEANAYNALLNLKNAPSPQLHPLDR